VWNLEKSRLLLLPLFFGLALMVYSWFVTYPISTVSANDLVFYHVSIYYWLSLPLLLGSMFTLAITTKNCLIRWVLSIAIILTIFSIFYFYYMIPTADSQYFRGLVENFIKTGKLDPSPQHNTYYQWPGYFVFADILTQVTGLSVANFEFLMISIIGFLFGSTLFVYASKRNYNFGVPIVVAFFVSIILFMDYQSCPFSIAISLLFLIFLLETSPRTNSSTIMILVLFASILITHLFVPVFLVLYVLLRSFMGNNADKRFYRNIFFITIIVYFSVELTLAKFSFEQIVINLTKLSTTYSEIVYNTFGAAHPSEINLISQSFSRFIIVASIGICATGFLLFLIKRKTNTVDRAILLTGVIYSVLGGVLNTLGYRAIAIAFIPISLGAAYLFRGKFRKYMTLIFLIILILFPFVPMHQTFNTIPLFHSKESYNVDNFFSDHYVWKDSDLVIAGYASIYLSDKTTKSENIQVYANVWEEPDAILYTPQYVETDLGNFTNLQTTLSAENLNLLYNDGTSFIIIKTK
jgi:hypothetical protein